VGAFGRCVEALRDSGFDDVVADAVVGGRPFLGICIGLQLLYEESEEDPDAKGLGILPGVVRRLPDHVKVPQMQWNRLRVQRPSRLFDGIDDRAWFYFVHSYAPDDADADRVVGTCDYGGEVVAAVELGPRQWAVQFHPEKSGPVGLRLLANFAAACR
jgi:glutamine amidotransferase